MIVQITEIDGEAAGRKVQLHLRSENELDVAVLEEMFRKTPVVVRAGIHQDRAGGNTDAQLYWMWPKEGK